VNRSQRPTSFRQTLQTLRIAYQHGDAGDLHDAYVRVMETSRALRALLSMLEHAYPVRRMLSMAARLESRLADGGLNEGCRRFFRELSIPWVCQISPEARAIAETQSVLFFGNHPSLFTPFLAAASIDREDFRVFSSKYVCHLLPSVARAAFPIEVPMTRSWTEWKRGGWQRVLIYRLIALLHSSPPAEVVREANQRSLEQGAAYIRSGGSAILCPGGGGKTRDRKWYSGIGSLVKQLQDQPCERTIYLLPFREENCSNKRIYTEIQRGPVSRLKRALVYRRPICIRFGNPIPVAQIGDPESSVQQVVDLLKAMYESLFPTPSLEHA